MPCHQQALPPHEGAISQYVGEVTAHNPLKDREGHKLNYARSQTPPPNSQAEAPHRWEREAQPWLWSSFSGVAWGSCFPIGKLGDDLFPKYLNCRNNLYLTLTKKKGLQPMLAHGGKRLEGVDQT